MLYSLQTRTSTRLFVSERKQIALMAEEKLPSRISLRLFTINRSEMGIKMIIRDLVVMFAVVITLLLGMGLRIKKDISKRWNIIYVIPAVISVIHFLISKMNIFICLVYFAAALELLLLILYKRRVLSATISVVSVFIAIIPLILTNITNSNCYASLGYVEAFKEFHEDMKEHYALQKWKGTDFDSKYKEYIGEFEKAEKNKDKTAYISAMLSYMASYQDGHVQLWDMYENFGLGSTRNIQNTYADIYKNYYGMTMLKLDSGKYVAANVEKDSSAQKAGIKNGTVITKWNEKDIKQQLSNMKKIIPVNCFMFADVENIERFKPIFLSCMGGKKMEIEFLNEKGKRKVVTLNSMGNGYPYLYKTVGLFLQKDSEEEAEFYYNTFKNNIGYLQVKGMGTDYDRIRSRIEKYIAQMKKDKISSLIVDVRNNAGGADETGVILAEQFAKEDLFYLKETTYDGDSGKYVENRVLKIDAKNRIDVPIYLLVNSNCISAGEGFAYNMAKLSNVTVVGIQGTNGSFGTIDGIDVMPEGMMGVFPSIACLDEDGSVMIDSKYHGTGGIKPEITIPVNREAVNQIFQKDYDYELEYLINSIII